MKEKKNILLVEDEENFGSVLQHYLQLHNYNVTLCTDGKKGLKNFLNNKYDLCILDVMMPEKDGFSLGIEIKKINSSTPFIFLTAKNLKEDILKGYQIGADDYISKPFDSEVLLYKLKAILHRKSITKEQEKTNFSFGQFKFDTVTRELISKDNRKNLTPKETQLLKLLCENMNDVVSRDFALNSIWKDSNYFTTRSMDVFIAKLRKYLKEDSNVEILNVHGNGFRLLVKK